MLEHKSLGGLPQVLSAMRLSSDPAIEKFLAKYDSLVPGYQRVAPWEAVAMSAGLSGRELLGAIILALRSYSANEVKITAITAHAEVTKATVINALTPDGHRDRQMIHTALGFLAPPKGQTINLNLPGFDQTGASEDSREIPAEDIDMNDLFPDLTATQRKLLAE